MQSFLNTIKRKRLLEKVCFVSSVGMICVLTFCTTTSKHIMPYVFSLTAVGSIILELLCSNGTFGMLEICHIGNALFVLFLWKLPQSQELFILVFALTNGPIMWAVFLFRNSLVLHSFSKMRSIYIHVIPYLLSFLIRWYREETSRFWNKEFMPEFMELSFTWAFVTPMAISAVPSVLVECLINLFKPTLTYPPVYEYLTGTPGSYWHVGCNLFGPKHQYAMYRFWYIVINSLYFIGSAVMYNSYTVHFIFITFITLCAAFNGASYYLEIFSARDQAQFLRSISHLTDKRERE